MKKTLIFLGGVATGGAALAIGELVWVTKKLRKAMKSVHLNDNLIFKFNELARKNNVSDIEEMLNSMLDELNEDQLREILNVMYTVEEKSNDVISKLEKRLEKELENKSEDKPENE